MKKIIVLLLFAVTMLFAQDRMKDDDDYGMPHGGRGLKERLSLTDDQASQIDQLRSDFQKKNIEVRANIATMRVTLHDLYNDDTPDQLKIEAQITNISKAQNELKLNASGFFFNVNKLLKPEQQTLWKEHFKMMIAGGMGEGKGFRGILGRMKERLGRYFGHGGGPGDQDGDFWNDGKHDDGHGRTDGKHRGGSDKQNDGSEKHNKKDGDDKNDDNW